MEYRKIRLEYAGFGKEKLLVCPEKTEDDYEKNRRVEFVILEMEDIELKVETE